MTYKKDAQMTSKEDAKVTPNEDRNLIRNCSWKFKCTKTWDSLLPAKHFVFERRRYCPDCKENVHLVTSESSLLLAIEHNYCVAIAFEITHLKQRLDQMDKPLVGSIKMDQTKYKK
jgi:hypothetical protein